MRLRRAYMLLNKHLRSIRSGEIVRDRVLNRVKQVKRIQLSVIIYNFRYYSTPCVALNEVFLYRLHLMRVSCVFVCLSIPNAQVEIKAAEHL